MIGSVVDACTSAIWPGVPPMEVISHAAPTDWIRPPKFDARLAIQISRKIVCRNGASWDGLVIAFYSRARTATHAPYWPRRLLTGFELPYGRPQNGPTGFSCPL